MPNSYASNKASGAVQVQLNKVTKALNGTFERLASGQRINSAGDGAADLALATSLEKDSRLASVAIRNANDGLSVTAIADSALDETANILQRMAELAEQGSNGTYTNVQRSALQLEFAALGSEIQRIAKTTEFNEINLLSNSSNIQIQVGFEAASTSQIIITGVSGTLQTLGLAAASSDALTFSLNGATESEGQAAGVSALNAINSAINEINSQRGLIGAAESRLNHSINNLSSIRENLTSAISNIRDADVAQEVAEMVRLQILQQAGTAVLAQANQQPGATLSLLQ